MFFELLNMAKVKLSCDIIKPFYGDVMAWFKKMQFIAKLQQIDDVANLVRLYLEGDVLQLYLQMKVIRRT